MNAAIMQSEALSFSAVVRLFFQSSHWHGGHCLAHIFSGCHAGHDVRKSVPAKPKAKTTPAHQGKFLSAPLSPSASACAAHTVKGRCALRSASLHCAPDLLARLRPSLLTTAAPREISPQGRRSAKAANAIPAFLISAYAFSGSSFMRAVGEGLSCRVSIMRFPLVRKVLSGISAFAFLIRCIRFPHVGLFVRHHPGGPGYVSYRRSASYFTPGRWLRPLDPRRKSRRLEKP